MTRVEEIELVAKSLAPSLTYGEVTAQRIRELVFSNLADVIADMNRVQRLSDAEKIALQNDFAFRFLHVRDLNTLVFSEPFEPWLDAVRPNLDFRFWRDYASHLEIVSRFSRDAVDAINASTDRILDLCGDPSKPALGLRKGLVVGNVQSGKTADYIGLITKAADAGYRVIIVLAGLLNTLRSQTQGRIDEGFVGISKIEDPRTNRVLEKVVGVGVNASSRPLSVLSLTTLQSDFTGRTAQSVTAAHGLDDSTVYVAVAKKNPATLRALLKWFSPAMCTRPMLLIDDEADNGGINYHGADTPTTINRLIRDLLGKFRRAAYAGYTATPFANIFIDPDEVSADHGEDLFPRDFVVALDAPDHYMGPRRIFGDDVTPEDDVVREIEDNESIIPIRHRRTLLLNCLPQSLVRALELYFVATAIRIARGDVTCHSSALVNVSRFIDVHKQVATLVRAEVNRIREAVRVYGALHYANNSVMTELHDLFEEEYSGCGLPWADVQPHLLVAVSPVEVLEIHMQGDARRLDYSRDNYPNGRRVVAVGGLSLSRGLTLEGLCASYVLRNSRMYDTLMQMGRWFGYRNGYGDVCRIHLTPEAIGWYRHITQAMVELWDEFAEMARAGLTPEQFGLRVKAHPLNLVVTAKNKMRSATEVTVQVNLEGRHVEPNHFDVRDLGNNMRQLDSLLHDIGKPNGEAAPCAGYYWTGVSLERIKTFLRDSRRLDMDMDTATEPICEYLAKLAMDGVRGCDVYLATTEGNPDCDVAGYHVCREAFRIEVSADGELTVGGGRKHVTSKGQERAGLASVVGMDALKRAEDEYLQAEASRKSVPGRFYRRFRANPLLVLHVVKGEVAEGSPNPTVDCSRIVVWRMVFPGDSSSYRPERLVSYVLNQVAARQYYSEQDINNDTEEDD